MKNATKLMIFGLTVFGIQLNCPPQNEITEETEIKEQNEPTDIARLLYEAITAEPTPTTYSDRIFVNNQFFEIENGVLDLFMFEGDFTTEMLSDIIEALKRENNHRYLRSIEAHQYLALPTNIVDLPNLAEISIPGEEDIPLDEEDGIILDGVLVGPRIIKGPRLQAMLSIKKIKLQREQQVLSDIKSKIKLQMVLMKTLKSKGYQPELGLDIVKSLINQLNMYESFRIASTELEQIIQQISNDLTPTRQERALT